MGYYTGIEVFVVNLDIPRRISADFDTAVSKQGSDTAFETGARHGNVLIDEGSCG